MKIKDEKYNIMKLAVKDQVDSFGKAIVTIKYAENPTKLIWAIWNKAYTTIRCNTGKEYYKEYFDVYSDGVNDSHIETAMKKIFKEIL
jgi:hypothetical protein